MQFSDVSDRIPKDKWPFIAGGVIAGALGVWVLGKIMEPYLAPHIKNVCRSYLGLDATGNPRGMGGMENVEAVRVEKGTMTKRINTVGVLRANAEVILKSETAGRIKAINFKEGETVNEGDLLIQFDDNDARAELESSKAEFGSRQAAYQREEKLRAVGHGAAKNYDEAKGNYEATKARVDKAQANLDKTQIIAPFSGTIGIIKVDVGEYVQPNAEMVKLVDNTPIKVDFKIPEKNLHEVGVGQIAEIRLDGFPNRIFSATVEAIDSAADAASHSIALRALIGNENNELRSGLYANISLIIGEKSNTLMIPESAIIRDGDTEYVWVVVKDNQVGMQKIITGTRENAKVEVLNGLPEGTLVVTAGQMKLGGGKRVNITNQPKPGDLLTDTPGAAKAPSLADKVLGENPSEGEPLKNAPPKEDAVKSEAPKDEALKAEAPKEEAPKVESPETPKDEAEKK